MDKWIVNDWAGNRLFPDREFDTFMDGWEFVHGQFPEDDWRDIYVLKADPKNRGCLHPSPDDTFLVAPVTDGIFAGQHDLKIRNNAYFGPLVAHLGHAFWLSRERFHLYCDPEFGRAQLHPQEAAHCLKMLARLAQGKARTGQTDDDHPEYKEINDLLLKFMRMEKLS